MNMNTFRRVFLIIIGTFIMSLAINGLFIPNKVLSGGLTGIAVLIHLVLNINPSIVILVVNIPLFIIGYFFVNKNFIIYSIIGTFSLSLFVSLTSSFHVDTQEMFTSILFGGALYGLGMGLVFRVNGSCGGSDIIAKLINKHFSISMATTNFALNIIVILFSMIFFNIDLAIYTLFTMFITAQVIKFVVEGLNYKKSVFIITNFEKEIASLINEKLNRGVTVIHGTGAYTGQNRDMLYCVISQRQVGKIRYLVRQVDPHAFITISDTSMVYGNGKGFYKLETE